MELDQLTYHAKDLFALAKGFIESGQEAVPTFILTDPNAIIPVAFENSADKDRVFGTLRHILKVTGASTYTFVCEAWSLKLAPGEAYDGRLPSQCADRVDTLHVDCWSRGGAHVVLFAEIKTTPEGRRVEVPTVETKMQTIGRAANLFEAEIYENVQ